MSLTLNLGVVDIPYATPPSEKGKATKAVTTTTGEVAGYLENKYHIMAVFYEQNADKIGEALAESLAGALESVMMGAPAEGAVPFAAAETMIDAEFRQFLALDVMATLGIPGVPTQAALAGVNTRLKTKKGATRPSFIDSGLYQASFKSWLQE